MELRTLEYFLAVVKEENISRAAEVLHITQPTLSRQLSQLENELGTPLFIRGKHLVLTEAGFLLKRRAEEVTSLIYKVEDEISKMEELHGVISIGSGGLMSAQLLSEALNTFKNQNPHIQYHFYTNSAEYIKEHIEQGLLDFGILLEPIDLSKFDYIRMKEEECFGVLMPIHSPYAHKSYITKDDLKDMSIMMSDRTSIQKEFESWYGESVDSLHIYQTYNIINNIVPFVANGHAYAMTLEGAVNYLDPNVFVFKPLYPALKMSSVLVWKKHQPHNNATSQLIEHIKSMH